MKTSTLLMLKQANMVWDNTESSEHGCASENQQSVKAKQDVLLNQAWVLGLALLQDLLLIKQLLQGEALVLMTMIKANIQ